MSSKTSKPPVSQPPPSSAIPGKSGGSGPYIAGVVVLAGLIAVLLFMRKGEEPKPPPPPAPAATSAQTAPQTLNAPPPPPKIEELDAGAEEGGAKVAGKGSGGGGGPCGKCGDGKSSPALESALRSTAASAQGCYNRALRTSEASGSMTVSVQVGPSGNVCGASIVKDSVNNGQISSCVRNKFSGRTFPAPASGCVVVNIPINFTLKQ